VGNYLENLIYPKTFDDLSLLIYGQVFYFFVEFEDFSISLRCPTSHMRFLKDSSVSHSKIILH
jgi:hypothetical protein